MKMGLQTVDRALMTKTTNKWLPIYIERAKIKQNNFGIIAYFEDGTSMEIPVGVCSSLALGPGTSITHGAISICADCNCVINWVGENCRIYYATGNNPTSTNKNALKQTLMRSEKFNRLEVVRRIFLERYPSIDINSIDLKNMMGIEGDLVKKRYHELGEKYGVCWRGRKYNHNNFEASDDINKAISSTNFIIYEACFSVIYSMGFLPSIGFIHDGTMMDFVLDIADIYKENISLDVAFKSVSICGKHEDINVKEILYDRMEREKFFAIASKAIYGIIWGENS